MHSNTLDTTSPTCNLCGHADAAVLATTSRSGKPLRTVICRQCGLVWSDPLPHDTRSFYEDDYRLAYKGAFTPKAKHILRAGKVALTRYRKLGNYVANPLKILDVGTGGGEFAYLLAKKGHRVSGIEPNKGYCAYSQKEYGLNIQNGFIQDIDQPDGAFDLITIWHVLEHTDDPTGVMRKLHGLLRPNGILVVEVPSIEATCQAPKSTFHEAHIYNFNLATLTKLGKKTGFKLLEQIFATDGGNMTLFFQKQTTAEAAADLTIPGNAEKIRRIVASHTAWKHYLTAHPYVRFIKRMANALEEKFATVGFASGKALLDKLYG